MAALGRQLPVKTSDISLSECPLWVRADVQRGAADIYS